MLCNFAKFYSPNIGEANKMGRIRTRQIKRVGRKLLADYRPFFGAKFEGNKAKITELIELKTKKLRNQIAGYVTKCIKTGAEQ